MTPEERVELEQWEREADERMRRLRARVAYLEAKLREERATEQS